MTGAENGDGEYENTKWKLLQMETASLEVTPVEIAEIGKEASHQQELIANQEFAPVIGSLAAADAWKPASEGESAGGLPTESVAPVLA